jgi:hypothetical protein
MARCQHISILCIASFVFDSSVDMLFPADNLSTQMTDPRKRRIAIVMYSEAVGMTKHVLRIETHGGIIPDAHHKLPWRLFQIILVPLMTSRIDKHLSTLSISRGP